MLHTRPRALECTKVYFEMVLCMSVCVWEERRRGGVAGRVRGSYPRSLELISSIQLIKWGYFSNIIYVHFKKLRKICPSQTSAFEVQLFVQSRASCGIIGWLLFGELG